VDLVGVLRGRVGCVASVGWRSTLTRATMGEGA
jgi:hypothetical protein